MHFGVLAEEKLIARAGSCRYNLKLREPRDATDIQYIYLHIFTRARICRRIFVLGNVALTKPMRRNRVRVVPYDNGNFTAKYRGEGERETRGCAREMKIFANNFCDPRARPSPLYLPARPPKGLTNESMLNCASTTLPFFSQTQRRDVNASTRARVSE